MKRSATWLSGFGFARLSARRRRILAWVFFGSLAVHVVGLLVFGGVVIMRDIRENATMFETPPPVRTYEPRKLEHRVKVREAQRSSSRPAMLPRVVSLKVSELALPEIKVDPKLIHTTFQPKFKPVSGRGLGAGLGDGYGSGGFGLGLSTVNFFGLEARGERIAILVDVSVSMVEAERGGPAGYLRVKQRVEEVIDALADGSLFNMIVFADAARSMTPAMVNVTDETRGQAKQFLRPFNTEGNWGLSQGNIRAGGIGLRAYGGTTRLDLALTGAFEQGADTILIISDGAPRVKKGYTAEDDAAWTGRMDAWHADNAGLLEAWNKAPVTTKRVWVPPRKAREPDGALKEGAPRDTGGAAREGYWKEVQT
ncbi:MAG: hypothetical protein JW951_00360, partial [Lentisphaerae bacterium]|nr:hypothetical protein [Lentisphaerota bacterium]